MSFFSSLLSPIASIASNLIGGSMSANSTGDAGANNAALQREFAQHGVRWRVEDAKAAGIHPMFAMGAQLSPASPAYVGDTGMSQAMSNIGQDVSRSVDATRTLGERVSARMQSLQLERGELENQLLRSQIAKLNAAPNPPLPASGDPYIISGQGNSSPTAATVDLIPMQRNVSQPGFPSKEAGVVPDFTYIRTPRGGLSPVAGNDVKQRIEDSFFPEMAHAWRNNISPNLPWNWSSHPTKPPRSMLPKGAHSWRWYVPDQAWMPAY